MSRGITAVASHRTGMTHKTGAAIRCGKEKRLEGIFFFFFSHRCENYAADFVQRLPPSGRRRVLLFRAHQIRVQVGESSLTSAYVRVLVQAEALKQENTAAVGSTPHQ